MNPESEELVPFSLVPSIYLWDKGEVADAPDEPLIVDDK